MTAGKLPAGYLCLVLHAHLPYVRHPEHEDFLEEDWLFEAITETYAPLLAAFERLDAERVPYRVTMGVTPPLAAMLGDPLLQGRYRRHLERQRELVEHEVAGHAAESPLGRLARFYQRFLADVFAFVCERHGGSVLDALRAARQRGSLEIITCTATHGFLPLLGTDGARRAQVRVGVEAYRRSFGEAPSGIWLAECAYAHGVDEMVAREGVDYFFLDSHGLLYGEPPPVQGVFAPIQTPAGCHAFARDTESSRQVWSAREGYPGDPWYREFYRDLGWDADYEYIRPYLHGDGVRRGVGIKYHRVTGDGPLHHKAFYEPAVARERAAVHAGHFLFHRQAQVRHLRAGMDRPPIVVAPYDAELFGHWWFEGPQFLEYLIRKAAHDQDDILMVSPTDYLERHPQVQEQEPCPSTWGAEGYAKVWLNGGNAAFYRHQHHAERRMAGLVERFPEADRGRQRALDQAARELLLLESSDWAFIVHGGTSVPYAVKRMRDHLQRFHRLADMAESGAIDGEELSRLEALDAIFPWLDYRVFR